MTSSHLKHKLQNILFLKGKKKKKKEGGKSFRSCFYFSVLPELTSNYVHTPRPFGIALIELLGLLYCQPAERFSQKSALINFAVLQRSSNTYLSTEKGEKNDKSSTIIIPWYLG